MLLPRALWIGAVSVLGACTLEDGPLRGAVPVGDGDADADADADVDADADADLDCTTVLPTTLEVLVGTMVEVPSGIACPDSASAHVCRWIARWNDDGDGVADPPSQDAASPCDLNGSFSLLAQGISDDAASFYAVELEVDGRRLGRSEVFVGQIRQVTTFDPDDGDEADVADLAVDEQERQLWAATHSGARMLPGPFDDEDAPMFAPSDPDCWDELASCRLSAVAVAGGHAWVGTVNDEEGVARVDWTGEELSSDVFPYRFDDRTRALTASEGPEGDDDPALYITTDRESFFLRQRELDDDPTQLDREIDTRDNDLAEIVATAVELDGSDEWLWRLDRAGHLQRLTAVGTLEPLNDGIDEDVLSGEGSALITYDGDLLIGQSDRSARAVHLDDLDPTANEPIGDIVQDFDPTMTRIVDFFYNEQTETLWALGENALYRLQAGAFFAYRDPEDDGEGRGDLLPDQPRSIASLVDEDGDEVVFLGAVDGLYIMRASLYEQP